MPARRDLRLGGLRLSALRLSGLSLGDLRPVLAAGTLVAVAAVWGSTFPISKDLLTRLPVPDFLALRFLTAALVVGLVRPAAVLRAGWRVFATGAGLGLVYFTGQYLQFLGLRHTAPTVSAFVVSMYVVFTPLLACLLARKLPSRRTVVATLLATTGVAALSLRGLALGWGEMLTLVAASVYAAHILALGRWSRARTAYVLAVVQLGTLGFAFLAVASLDGVQLPQSRDVPAFLYLALFAGGLALLGQTWAQAHLPAPTVSIIMVLEPVWAGVIGVSVFGERLDARIVLGGLLVLSALVVVTGRGRGVGGVSHGAGTSQDNASQESASQDGTSQDGTSQDSASQDSASQDGMGQDCMNMGQEGRSQNGEAQVGGCR